MSVRSQTFGITEDSSRITEFILTNTHGVEVSLIDYGAIITSINVPDRAGKYENVVLGFDELEPYLNNPFFIGSTVGRYCNRIADSRFQIGETEYILSANNGVNHLHGGLLGFDKVKWKISAETEDSVEFFYLSKNGEMGYPGNLEVKVRFILTTENEVEISYSAVTDQTTHINLTNHSYFNLTGSPLNKIIDHELWINADNFTPVDDNLIPTGKIETVKSTSLDFTTSKKIGRDLNNLEKGFDHNFVLNRTTSHLNLAASLLDPISGRKLEVFTTEPGIQFYSGYYLDGSLNGPNNIPFEQYSALCLETQHFPNSPNIPSFPSTLLQPNEVYSSFTKYKFTVID